MPPAPLLAIEKLIATAHRCTWQAAELCDQTSRHSAALDLEQIALELSRIQEALLRA